MNDKEFLKRKFDKKGQDQRGYGKEYTAHITKNGGHGYIPTKSKSKALPPKSKALRA